VSRTRPLGLICLAALFFMSWGRAASGQSTQPQPSQPAQPLPQIPSVGLPTPPVAPSGSPVVPQLTPDRPPGFRRPALS
jgi:hypothetical protein